MRQFVLFLVFGAILAGCSNDDKKLNNNPYLTNPVVSLTLNLNLPEYNPLKFPGNYIVAPQGIKGIVVYCVNDSQYLAFDLTDPNHPPSDCSKMELEGIIAKCPCTNDDNEYYIITGQHASEPDTKYPMQPYRAQRNGNVVTVRN